MPAGTSFIERHAGLTLRDLKQPLTLEVIPSLTYSRHETRVSPDTFGPASSEPDAGISARYGVTSSITVEGTVNPDFSQVESDTFQVEVNQRFPVFYPEKRPFFMEGVGTFELAGAGGDSNMRTAVHTRVIEDPLWGGKSSGTAGKVAFAFLAAGDEAPGRAPTDGSANPFLGERKAYTIARGEYSLGRTSYVGALITDTELAAGHNRVAATDVSLKLGNHFTSGTVIATTTRTPDGLQAKSGLAGQAYYVYETKPFLFATQAEHYDTDFQMDTAFVNQTGVTQGWSFIAPSFYPDPKKTSWHEVLTDFLASWELIPGTVAYAGYGSIIERRAWDGSGFTDDPTGATARRSAASS